MNQALLIIDIQNDYFAGGRNPLSNSEETLSKAKAILDFFRKEKKLVIHIQHLSNRPGASFFIPGTNGAEIHDLLKPFSKEKIITKHYPNSFRETELLDYLKKMNIKELVVCGMMTHMCVDATVRAAKDFGFNCTVIADACATKELEINGEKVNARDVHHSFLAALSYFYAKVITVNKFLN